MSIQEWRKPIIAVPLQQAFPQLDEIKEFRSKVCLFNHDRSRLFDVVSPRYQVINHGEAFDRINQGLSEYFGKEVSSAVRTLDGGVSIRAEFKLPIAPIKIGRRGEDVNELTMVMQNSYNRSLIFKAELGAFRLICSNGMKIGESFGAIKSKHVQGADGSGPSLLDELDLLIARAPGLKDVWEEWSAEKVEYEQAALMLEGKFPEKYLGPVLDEERFPRTKWELYNDLTRFATHDTSSVRRRMEFDDRIAALFYGGEVEDAEVVE